MKSTTRTAVLLAGAVVALVAPLAVLRLWQDPADPRISVGAPAAGTLIPGDIRDATGRMVAGAVWTGLTAHDPATGTAVNAAAESITSADRRVWTVRLRAGGRFHDGSPVTAGSFAGAWTAVVREGWAGARMFTEVARMRGAGTGRLDVQVTDPRTLRVTLDRPLAGFPSLLADPAFLPMPEPVLRSRDWSAYDRRPVGNGPYRVRSRGPGEIVLTRPGARDVVVRAMDAARQYAAARKGDLDVATQVPAASHGSMESDFRRRHLIVPGRAMTYLGLPLWEERFASPTVRQSLSLAIDRAAVADGPLGYQATPAKALVPPGIVPGRREGQCRVCVYDPRAANAALADTGKLSGQVNLWYETGAGDEAWVPAVARQLGRNLGIDVRPRPVADLDKALEDRTVDGPFVLHSVPAYSSPVAALAPLLDANTGYRDEYSAGLLDQASGAASVEEGVTSARLAESALLRDLPVIPLWSAHDHLVWSSRIEGVTADAFGGLRLDRLRIR